MNKQANEARYYGVTLGGDLECLRGDLHHMLNPLIGHLRMVAHPAFDPASVHFDPRRAVVLPETAPATVTIETSDLVVLVQRMMLATDLADAALGERPMREQIAAMQAELETARRNRLA